MSKEIAKLAVVAPVSRSQAAPFADKVREMCSGAGASVAQIMAALKLSDREARRVIDHIRAKESYDAFPRVGKAFVYRGLDGKGFAPKAK
jgi:hypothetical protein